MDTCSQTALVKAQLRGRAACGQTLGPRPERTPRPQLVLLANPSASSAGFLIC